MRIICVLSHCHQPPHRLMNRTADNEQEAETHRKVYTQIPQKKKL